VFVVDGLCKVGHDDGDEEADEEQDDGEMKEVDLRDDGRPCVLLSAPRAAVSEIKTHPN